MWSASFMVISKSVFPEPIIEKLLHENSEWHDAQTDKLVVMNCSCWSVMFPHPFGQMTHGFTNISIICTTQTLKPINVVDVFRSKEFHYWGYSWADPWLLKCFIPDFPFSSAEYHWAATGWTHQKVTVRRMEGSGCTQSLSDKGKRTYQTKVKELIKQRWKNLSDRGTRTYQIKVQELIRQR